MIKLFLYELRRFRLNKFFIGLLAVTMLYSMLVMDSDIILGVANTAPFSPWSFGTYLAKLLPLLLIALLFLLSFLSSKQEKEVRALTDATPISPSKYRALRYGAITTAFALITLLPVGYGWWFYAVNFHITDFGGLLAPMLCTLIPAFLFIMGLGSLAGRIHSALVFVLMPVVLLAGFLPIADSLDLYGSSLYMKYPLTLGVLDPSFCLPPAAILWKLIYSVSGIAMLLIVTLARRPHAPSYEACSGIE